MKSENIVTYLENIPKISQLLRSGFQKYRDFRGKHSENIAIYLENIPKGCIITVQIKKYYFIL